MAQPSELSRDLRRWWDQQSTFSTIKQFAERAGIPYSSLKKYFSGQKQPGIKNRQLLFNVTQLDILRPEKTPVVAAKFPLTRPISKKVAEGLNRRFRYASSTLAKLSESLTKSLMAISSLAGFLQTMQGSGDTQFWLEEARATQYILDALEKILRPFLESPEGLQILRSQVSGPDAGYISGLLAALFDDTRLSNWKAMTTYTYGESRHAR